MANQSDLGASPATERESAPVLTTPRQLMPREMDVERVGDLSSGVTVVYPGVRGGVCEYCGVLDPNVPSQFQYKLCAHYRGKQLSCSYCPRTKDVDEVIGHTVLRVLQHPSQPNKMIVCCDSWDCRKKHEDKWSLSV